MIRMLAMMIVCVFLWGLVSTASAATPAQNLAYELAYQDVKCGKVKEVRVYCPEKAKDQILLMQAGVVVCVDPASPAPIPEKPNLPATPTASAALSSQPVMYGNDSVQYVQVCSGGTCQLVPVSSFGSTGYTFAAGSGSCATGTCSTVGACGVSSCPNCASCSTGAAQSSGYRAGPIRRLFRGLRGGCCR